MGGAAAAAPPTPVFAPITSSGSGAKEQSCSTGRMDHFCLIDGGVVDDRFDLQRFVEAQDRGDAYAHAVRELRAGRKTGHWMWFVFPQVAGLGRSATSRHFAISGLDEAAAYLAHPVLGPRLVECAHILTGLPTDDARAVLGPVDAQKLRSSMTLFARAAPDEPAFRAVLDTFFAGRPDEDTLARL